MIVTKNKRGEKNLTYMQRVININMAPLYVYNFCSGALTLPLYRVTYGMVLSHVTSLATILKATWTLPTHPLFSSFFVT